VALKPRGACVQFLIDEETKKAFFARCAEEAVSPSAWLRKQIIEFLKRRAR